MLNSRHVTILILIDGFLQYMYVGVNTPLGIGHNPYFNRWFSAIKHYNLHQLKADCHNPYFNRWFSAIFYKLSIKEIVAVTILILIDGFLQFKTD